MITTTQVRSIMRNHSITTIYTNKNKNNHTVKCYMPRDSVIAQALLKDIEQHVSSDNIKISNISYHQIPSIIVTCIKA
jgi:hypothetical protein